MKKICLLITILFLLCSCKIIRKQDLIWNHKHFDKNGIGKIFLNNDSICYKNYSGLYRVLDSTGNIIADSIEFIDNKNESIKRFANTDSLRKEIDYKSYRYKVITRLPINKNFKYGSTEFNKFDEIQVIYKHGWFRSSLDKPFIVFMKRKKNGKLKQIKYKLDKREFYDISDCIPYMKDKLIIQYESQDKDYGYTLIGMLDLNKLPKKKFYIPSFVDIIGLE